MPDRGRNDRPDHRAGTSAQVCPAEHSGWLTNPVRRLFNNPRRILRGLVKNGDVALDLGCGTGYFTLPLAKMVGDEGTVVAVDVQAEMLDRLRVRAEKAGLLARVRLHLAAADGPGVVGPADFALAFWMLHEVPDIQGFLRQVRAAMKPDGLFLLVEPITEVSAGQFADTVRMVEQSGFEVVRRPRVGLSRAGLFRRL